MGFLKLCKIIKKLEKKSTVHLCSCYLKTEHRDFRWYSRLSILLIQWITVNGCNLETYASFCLWLSSGSFIVCCLHSTPNCSLVMCYLNYILIQCTSCSAYLDKWKLANCHYQLPPLNARGYRFACARFSNQFFACLFLSYATVTSVTWLVLTGSFF